MLLFLLLVALFQFCVFACRCSCSDPHSHTCSFLVLLWFCFFIFIVTIISSISISISETCLELYHATALFTYKLASMTSNHWITKIKKSKMVSPLFIHAMFKHQINSNQTEVLLESSEVCHFTPFPKAFVSQTTCHIMISAPCLTSNTYILAPTIMEVEIGVSPILASFHLG